MEKTERSLIGGLQLSTRDLAVAGIFGALSIVLAVTPLGMIPVPNISAAATTLHIPAIIAAIVSGPVVGAVVGLILAITSWYYYSAIFLNFMGGNLVFALVDAFLPRILIGVLAYYAFRPLRKRPAVAAGIAAGLGLGLNSRGVLLTRGVVEMRRLLPVFGGDPQTLYGLAGFGDIIATALSENSRNHRAGVEFAQGVTLAQVEGESKMVAEGVRTVRAVVEFLDAPPQPLPAPLELPITRETYAVIYDAKPPRDAIAALMSRPYKEEG